MKQGETITLQNGAVNDITIHDQSGVHLIVNNVKIQNQTILK